MLTNTASREAKAAHTLSFFLDLEPSLGDFRADILEGLRGAPKTTPPKYLYDEKGSAIFDQICDAPEYYPTRTEIGILRECASEIASLIGPDAAVIELGSGSSVKIRILLDALETPALYVAQDISREHLLHAAKRIAADYDDLAVGAVCSDFTQPIHIPEDHFVGAQKRVVFFPGSTIGNFAPDDAVEILRVARGMLRPGDGMILGADLKKDPAILVPAYDDAAGVTAAFNLNLLERLNRELDGDIHVQGFAHRARYNQERARIEMHLESLRAQSFTVAGETFVMAAGETIHTENSHKFDTERLEAMAVAAGFTLQSSYRDADALFSVNLLVAV